MNAEQHARKTFQVTCPHCEQPFHVRFALADPSKEGSSEVGVVCQYCEKKVMVEIPSKYVESEVVMRLKGRTAK